MDLSNTATNDEEILSGLFSNTTMSLKNESLNHIAVRISGNVDEENFLNKLSVQILLVIAYTFVFCCCFIGKLLSFDQIFPFRIIRFFKQNIIDIKLHLI
jgi:hypothetical protein